MAWKTTKVGSILKPKDDTKSNYIKFDTDFVAKKGSYLSVESKKYKLSVADRLEAENKIKPDHAEKMRTYANKMPDFVLAELILSETD